MTVDDAVLNPFQQPAPAASPAPMEGPSVAICVATFRRPAGLKALLRSLDALELPYPAPKVRIVVVDNDAENPIGPPDPAGGWSTHELTYVVESTRGIAAARNRALKEAGSEVDFIAFVDDDEVASPGWLKALLATAESTGATIVQGPVSPDFPPGRPDWAVGGWCFEIGPFKEGQRIYFAGTNNSLIRRSAIDALGRGFDMRFNLSGGEDIEFTTSILRASGGHAAASANAKVTETVPEGRLTYRWVLQRGFRCGNTLGRLARMGRESVPRRAFLALARMGRGVLSTITLGIFRAKARVDGVTDVFWGAGTIAGLIGIGFEEYKNVEREPSTVGENGGVAA